MIRKSVLKYFPLIFLLLLASLEFILLLRHKSPYMSDSYFYQHIYYQMQGDSYGEAHDKILKKLDVNKLSNIEKNMFFNADKYQYSLSRYVRRPLYPFMALLTNFIVRNDYLAFLLPVFVSYLGVIAITYLLFRYRFDLFWSTLGTLLFMRFYPYLDWSTYFLTDTIGAFFWMLQIYLIIKYIIKPQSLILIVYVISLILSLLAREQSVLMILIVVGVFIINKIYQQKNEKFSTYKKLFIASSIITIIFFIINTVFKFPSLYDSWIYLQSNFGYNNQNYSLIETARFLWGELIKLHVGLVDELVRHRWWLIITFLGFYGTFLLFIKHKKTQLIDILIFVSALASYIGLIIIPYLTYRYFYPTIIGIIYFAIYSINIIFYPKTADKIKRLK